MSNVCGDCLYYPKLNGSFLCQKTGKVVGYLHMKECFTPKPDTKMENTQEQPKTKVCKRCGRELPIHEFGRHARTKDGLQTYCRQCTSDAMKKARIKKVAKPLNPSESGSSDLCFIRTEDLLSELKRRGFSGYLKRVEEFSI